MMETRSTLGRTLAILELFTEERLEWTPEAMMETLGYSRPTLYRYLKALKESGFLTSLAGAGWTLGPKFVEMDFLLRKSDPLTLTAQPHLEFIAAAHPCTALVVRWYGGRLLCVASECRTTPVSSYPRGRAMPFARGAISRAIMAHLPRRQLLPLVAAHLPDLSAIGLGNEVDEVLESLREVRRTGFAMARGEVTPGVVGIAAPVFDAAEAPIAALCATSAASHVDDARLLRMADDIRAAARDITLALRIRRDLAAAEPVSHIVQDGP